MDDFNNIDGREMAVIKPGDVEIMKPGDLEQTKARMSFYMGQVQTILEAGELMIPFGYPKEPKAREAAVKVAIMYAMELGMPPVSGLRSVYFVNQRPCLHSDGPPAVALASGLVADMWSDTVGYAIIENWAGGGPLLGCLSTNLRGPVQLAAAKAMEDATNDRNWRCAFAVVWRKGMSMPVTRIFSMTDANRAGVFSKKGEIWEKHTWRMLLARARTFACRDAVPEAYQGLVTIEEAQEIEAREAKELGQPVAIEGIRTVETIIADAAQGANVRASEDIERFRSRARATLRTKFSQQGGAAWKVASDALFGGAEPKDADQWATAAHFLEEMPVNDARLAKATAAA